VLRCNTANVLDRTQMVPVADYREISQEYAKQGINAAFLLNGGAAVALLSQTAALREQGLSGAISSRRRRYMGASVPFDTVR
jgi:hypothetical protein